MDYETRQSHQMNGQTEIQCCRWGTGTVRGYVIQWKDYSEYDHGSISHSNQFEYRGPCIRDVRQGVPCVREVLDNNKNCGQKSASV